MNNKNEYKISLSTLETAKKQQKYYKSMEYNEGNIIIYQFENGNTHLEVLLDDMTVWLSQLQMGMYQSFCTNVVEHIKQ